MRLLSWFVDQFIREHQSPPTKIVVAPVAAVALSLKSSLGPMWAGVPVEMRLFEQEEVVAKGTGTKLGVFLREAGEQLSLVCCDLR